VSAKIESNKKVKKNKTTKAWITEHVNDAYVQRARVPKAGVRAPPSS
jgi:hypothetical protein